MSPNQSPAATTYSASFGANAAFSSTFSGTWQHRSTGDDAGQGDGSARKTDITAPEGTGHTVVLPDVTPDQA